ncbi:MAG: sulfatase-like hydrolase/transferase [Acidimicrobiales bacterium]
MTNQPNILLIVSDEERRTDWLKGAVSLPAHDRLTRDGLSFERYYTHTSPCSPSRASLYTGRYLPAHGVVDNVSFPEHVALDPAIPTIGSMLRESGYRSAYVGKWHLSHGEHPDMGAYGYEGWQGNDRHFTGSPWTGRHFDPEIAGQAVEWMQTQAVRSTTPWFLTVALVNPHDVMWYPIDQPWYRDEHPKEADALRQMMAMWMGDFAPAPLDVDYPRRFHNLPANFDDDLHTKPEIQRAWRWVRNREHLVGAMDHGETNMWLRQLDYYAWLHERLDESLAIVLNGLDSIGAYDDTVIILTSDHGDACGSHGLRAKLPCVYEEVMGVPLIVKAPGLTRPRTSTNALATHVDLATTIASLGTRNEVADRPKMQGKDLTPVLAQPDATVRDYVLFAQDSAQSTLLRNSRYAVRGYFDGTTKYARYYGIGGGIPRTGTEGNETGTKLFGPDSAFDDQDHEWYDHVTDTDELVNLAHDRSRRDELRDIHARLLSYEQAEFRER